LTWVEKVFAEKLFTCDRLAFAVLDAVPIMITAEVIQGVASSSRSHLRGLRSSACDERPATLDTLAICPPGVYLPAKHQWSYPR